MAELTGLEPATSAVTGQRSNQLSYNSTREAGEVYFFLNALQMNLKLFENPPPEGGILYMGIYPARRANRKEERSHDTRATNASAATTAAKAQERSKKNVSTKMGKSARREKFTFRITEENAMRAINAATRA